MRKYLILAVAAITALAVASFAFAGSFADDGIQTITAKLTPTKLDKKKYSPAKIFIDIKTGNNTGDAVAPNQPPSANRTIVDFPTNLKFDTTAVPNCEGTEAELQNTTTEQAIAVCGKASIVSVPKTSAHVTVDQGASAPLAVPITVTAFNGTAKNQLYLHAKASTLPVTSVLVGKLKKGPTGYGNSLDVTIPPLLAGAIDDFTTTVKAGKYVQARCKSKTNKFQARSFYTNHTPTVATFTTKCSQK
ncbi:MAG: hypothetical protein H0V25_12415 [Solirubrobacterales bacterium]|nr:hypothetical protein [Solirubrobacterales bacterium]